MNNILFITIPFAIAFDWWFVNKSIVTSLILTVSVLYSDAIRTYLEDYIFETETRFIFTLKYISVICLASAIYFLFYMFYPKMFLMIYLIIVIVIQYRWMLVLN